MTPLSASVTSHLEAFPSSSSSSTSRSSSIAPNPPRPPRDARRTPPRTPVGVSQELASSAESSPAVKTKLKKSNSKRRKENPPSGYPSSPPNSAFGPSKGFAKGNASTPDLPSHISPSSSPSGSSRHSNLQRSPAPESDFVSVDSFRERPTQIQLSQRGWSEKEKAEKWDALLEKSNKAGGTLHVSLGLAPGQMDVSV